MTLFARFACVLLCLMIIGYAKADTFHTTFPKEAELVAFSHWQYSSAYGQTDLTRTKIRFTWAPPEGWGGRLCVSLSDHLNNKQDPNWVLENYIQYAPNPVNTIRFGRLFLAAMWQTPPPHILRSVRYYGNEPYGVYAYGVQYERWFGQNNSWQFMVDVSGNSNRRFDDDGQFDRVESSVFLEHKATSKLTWNVGGQVSSDFRRFGLGAQQALGSRTLLTSTVYYTSERSEHTTGFMMLETKATAWLTPRLTMEHDQQGRTTLIPGVLLRPVKYLLFTADYERGDLTARLQVRL